jgi:hypothetical protein
MNCAELVRTLLVLLLAVVCFVLLAGGRGGLADLRRVRRRGCIALLGPHLARFGGLFRARRGSCPTEPDAML